ncbi:MAG: DUF47 family protein [Chloroflexales bacterium]|nr:DUF47 family protein [Chloroflexales bacterium]
MKLFRRKSDRFMILLLQQAEYTVQGIDGLMAYLRTPSDECANYVRRIEKEADETRRILIDELNHSFVTPLDREDIFSLSRSIDDMLDYAYSTVSEMQILNIESNQYLEQMISLIRDAAEEIRMAMVQLKDHPNVANDHAVRAKALENRVEQVYREAIAALFQGPQDVKHVVEMLKLREIYRHLSNAADRGDEAANVISDAVVKMT